MDESIQLQPNNLTGSISTSRSIVSGFSYIMAFALGMATMFGLMRYALPVQQTGAVQAANQPQIEQQAQPQPTEMPVAKVSDTLAGARETMRLGSATEPVQIVIFADPQCPFCKQNALGAEKQIIQTFVETGKAAITYRHFTFLGPESERIAVAMECASEQGAQAFWDFHTYAFEHQFPENAGQATDDAMLMWARSVKLDEVKFKRCVTDPLMQQRVQADTQAGRKLGVVGTPTVFINGRPMPGALPFDFVRGTIEGQLAQTNASP